MYTKILSENLLGLAQLHWTLLGRIKFFITIVFVINNKDSSYPMSLVLLTFQKESDITSLSCDTLNKWIEYHVKTYYVTWFLLLSITIINRISGIHDNILHNTLTNVTESIRGSRTLIGRCNNLSRKLCVCEHFGPVTL